MSPSRTPERLPRRCPHCGTRINIEFADFTSDAACPRCGCPMWLAAMWLEQIRDEIHSVTGNTPETLMADTSLVNDLGMDSGETVELAMHLEEELDINFPQDAVLGAGRWRTVGDVIRSIELSWRGRDGGGQLG